MPMLVFSTRHMIPKWPQISQCAAMRRDDICIYVSPANRARLQPIIADRNSKTKTVWRARIVLATVDGHGTNAIMRLTVTSKPCVWRWQERYIAEGVEGLLRDKTRPPGKKPLWPAVKRKVLSKTASELPPYATHWDPELDGGRDAYQSLECGTYLGRCRLASSSFLIFPIHANMANIVNI